MTQAGPAPAHRPAGLGRPPQLALVDLDGTLVDTVPDIAASVDHALERQGFEAPGEGRVRDWIGNGATRLLDRALADALGRAPDAPTSARSVELFMAHYAEHLCVRSRVYPGVLEGLDYLSGAGAALACVTNKPERFARALLADVGLGRYFALTLGGDSLDESKPHPAPLEHAMRALGASAGRTLMIGDSAIDVRAARAAGVPVICMRYGYNSGADVAGAAPDAVLDSMAGLPGLFVRED